MPSRFPSFPQLARRLAGSAVAWSWAFNFLRLASGLLLLPLLLKLLPKPDLGMYYLFLSLNALNAVLDLGFSPTLGRFVNYAMGGATRLSAHGVERSATAGKPNLPLLWELLHMSKVLYGLIALAVLLLLGSFGSFMVAQKVAETSAPGVTWLAWGISILAVATEAYFHLWNIFLRNMNEVLAAMRIGVAAYAVRVALACGLLLAGGGLLALPVASVLSVIVIAAGSRRGCLRILAACVPPAVVDWRTHFRTLWPNSWRLGLYFGGAYLSTNANVLLCSKVFGLEANAEYGLSVQVVGIINGLAAVWTMVKWPLLGQHIARHEVEPQRRIFWPRVWLQLVTFAALALAAMALGPWLIRFIGSDKQMLAQPWLALLLLNGLLDAHCSAWNTLIAMGNRLPMLWPSLATNAAGLALNLAIIQVWPGVPGLLAVGPPLAGLAFNYWHWPGAGARTLQLSFREFVRYGFARPPRADAGPAAG